MKIKNSLLLGWPISSQQNIREPIYAKKSFTKNLRQKLSLANAVRYSGDGHLITFAPTGAGKGVSTIIPTLLSYPGSTIVIDPKGENFLVTARYRSEIGQKVYVLDPFKIVTPCTKYINKNKSIEFVEINSSSLNPLDFLIGLDQLDDSESQTIAVSLAERSGSNAFWDNLATLLLTGLIQLVVTSSDLPKSKKTLSTVVDILFMDNFDEYIHDIVRYKNIDIFSKRALEGYLSAGVRKTRHEILSFARGYLGSLTTESIRHSISQTTIDLDELVSGGAVTVYIVFPASKLESYSKLLRVWVTVLIRVILTRKNAPKMNTLFLLDECAQLGELEQLRTAVTLLRGYGLQAWMFFQDLSQIKERYHDWENIVNNCAVLQSFGLSRDMAAKPIAKLVGRFESEDLLGLGRYQQLIAQTGVKPRIAELMTYWSDPAFSGRADKNDFVRDSEQKNKW
ncbi:MAG: hypothetical protein NMNS01_17730 [Nitrosomonas sp.]|nr:MAG: hypothetical protein NMNS01_17730 [Nitrosomonas sp.]